jgi:predicted Fe-Mo cluster-binding NifX family protein
MDNLYTVIVNTEDGESAEYEIEAGSFHEATKQAEEMANSVLGDITYVEVYLAQ